MTTSPGLGSGGFSSRARSLEPQQGSRDGCLDAAIKVNMNQTKVNIARHQHPNMHQGTARTKTCWQGKIMTHRHSRYVLEEQVTLVAPSWGASPAIPSPSVLVAPMGTWSTELL